MPERRTPEQLEAAADQYIQNMITRERAARQAESQTQTAAQGQGARNGERQQQEHGERRRQRQGFTLR
jgi:hypothetical protein